MASHASKIIYKFVSSLLTLLSPAGFLFMLGCAATIDVTKAPFRATTHLSEATTDAAAVLTRGTTQATKDLTRPIKQLIRQMAPGGEGQVSHDLELVAFTIMNHDHLMNDIAQGQGEYLGAFGLLLGLPSIQLHSFYQELQSRYHWLYDDRLTPFQSLDRLLSEYYDPDWLAAVRPSD